MPLTTAVPLFSRLARCSSQLFAFAVVLAVVLGGGVACHDLSELAGKQTLPAGTPDPNSFNTPAGALAFYHSVLYFFQASSGDTATTIGNAGSEDRAGTFVNVVLTSGLLTDELQAGNFGGNQLNYQSTSDVDLLDARQLTEGVQQLVTDGLYTELQGIRNSATLAIAALATYDPNVSPALRGELYALQGYSEIFLADLYCSGVPLSSIEFHGDFTFQAGSTTDALYQAAIAKFDTAISLSGDSARIQELARIGKGRAYLDRGIYDSAAAAVKDVSPAYRYQFLVDWSRQGFPGGLFKVSLGNSEGVTVADSEGGTGIPYLSSGDPRAASATWGTNDFGVPQYAPVSAGGATLGIAPIAVATEIEARLIQAEAAYHGVATGTGSWLDQLNALRQTAITPALPLLSDPGATLSGSAADSARVALLFRERAFWLFLTGHRQGDLRRRIRNYHTSPNAVYPTGAYPLFGALSMYGGAVTAPIPTEEHANPRFTGCLSHGA